MKKLLFCLGLAILCTSIPTWHSAVGQQVPDVPGQRTRDTDDNGRLSNRQLVELVTAQTAAIRALDERLKALESRVDDLEDEGNR